MLNLYESILKSTGAGAFRFTDDMLVRYGKTSFGSTEEIDCFSKQFDLRKMMKDLNITKAETESKVDVIWKTLCHIKTGKTWKEAQKALIHGFIWDGPEDKFFKDIFKDYLINPKDFDFFCYTEDKPDEIYIATHDHKGGKGGKSRGLFTIKPNFLT